MEQHFILCFTRHSYLLEVPILLLGIMNVTALELIVMRVLVGFLQQSLDNSNMGQTASQPETEAQASHQHQHPQHQQQHQPQQHRQKKGKLTSPSPSPKSKIQAKPKVK